MREFVLPQTVTAPRRKLAGTLCLRSFAYYYCPKQGCVSRAKTVRRETLESEFESLLQRLQPSEDLFELAYAMFKALWDERLNATEAEVRARKEELAKIERSVEQLLDRIAVAESPTVIGAYERRIRALEEQKAIIAEKLSNSRAPARSFEESLQTALQFLANPWKLWNSPRLDDKRTVLKLAFTDRIPYVMKEGFQTANLALPFRALAEISGEKNGWRARLDSNQRPAASEAATLSI